MEPLASRLRPRNLDEYIGQEHLVGNGESPGPLRLAIEQKHLFSFILWGPPGVGKTTLARIYAAALNAEYHELSAVSASKDDVRKLVEPGADLFGPRILFLDEIHRFNKAQQDYLLPAVESGKIILIGATTENPSFEVIPALLSRCRVFVLNSLDLADMQKIIARTGYEVDNASTEWLLGITGGDARQAIAIIENTVGLYGEITIDTLSRTLQTKRTRYDKHGDEHHNTISAFIKSMRASQTDAALYYLARMVTAGEDPKFIARRMAIFASEDIGMKYPNALSMANAVFRAVETIGYPEAGINLAHGVIYLSKAPKNRSVYDAFQSAMKDAEQYANAQIPLMVRNASTKLVEKLGYGSEYQYYTNIDMLPDELKGKKYWSDAD